MEIGDKVVLLTGASRGLGVLMAKELGARGGRLALAARSADDLEKVRSEVSADGIEAITVTADVSDPASLHDLVASVEKSLGAIDVLVNNAGIEQVCEFEEMTMSEIARLVDVNVIGLLQLTRLVVPSMIERSTGHIVNISSMAGLLPVPHNAVYSATKHAVVGISRSLRLELGDHGIGVSVVCPTFVDGGMFASWGRKPPSSAAAVTPEQVAAAVVSAILRNKGEIRVVGGLGKLGPTLTGLSPTLSSKIMNSTGVVGFLREQAKLNADKTTRG